VWVISRIHNTENEIEIETETVTNKQT
jgi:hypothetical protein